MKVIKSKDVLTNDEALTINGGVNQSYYDYGKECTCDCWWVNKNKTRPTKPTRPGEIEVDDKDELIINIK